MKAEEQIHTPQSYFPRHTREEKSRTSQNLGVTNSEVEVLSFNDEKTWVWSPLL